MKNVKNIILAVCIPLAFSPLLSQAKDDAGSANWRTNSGAYWKNSSGQCWRSSSWTPALAVEECDPDLFKKDAPKVADATPQPAYIAPASAPVQTMRKKVSFSAEDLFGFDKSELKPEGKEKLDQLVADLNNTNYDVIVATGHADRIGNKVYNQKLSERRAESVRAYLVSKGITSDKISASGKGETEPVTKPGECKGAFSKKLVACLQPDRRVEIEVTGTQVVPASAQ